MLETFSTVNFPNRRKLLADCKKKSSNKKVVNAISEGIRLNGHKAEQKRGDCLDIVHSNIILYDRIELTIGFQPFACSKRVFLSSFRIPTKWPFLSKHVVPHDGVKEFSCFGYH